MSAAARTRTKKANLAADPLAEDILRAMRRILRKISEHSRQLARDGDLTVSQLLCLRVIADAAQGEPPTLTVIAAQVQLSTATVSRILDRLEQRGLLLRTRSTADRRKVIVSLSPRGRRQLSKLPAPLHDEFLSRLTCLKKSEQSRLLEALETIVEMMGAGGLDAAPLLTAESVRSSA